jgi:hypothetical protein
MILYLTFYFFDHNSNLVLAGESGLSSSLQINSGPIYRYENRAVPIPDLPIEWEARVDPEDGGIVFIHTPTGTKQRAVPPGYADLKC